MPRSSAPAIRRTAVSSSSSEPPSGPAPRAISETTKPVVPSARVRIAAMLTPESVGRVGAAVLAVVTLHLAGLNVQVDGELRRLAGLDRDRIRANLEAVMEPGDDLVVARWNIGELERALL